MKVALLALLLTAFSSYGAAADKPNIVFFLADDLGYGELGCYGQEKIKTPRIDSIAAEGMRFTRAYSGNAVCAPSRCVLMTSKHPGKATIRNNKRVEPEGQYPIGADEITLAERLKAEGYVCGAFGKWGLGNVWSEGNPTKQGFDRFFGYNCQTLAHSYYPESLWSNNDPFPLKNNPPIPGHANLAPGADPSDPASYKQFVGQDYSPDRIQKAAMAFLRENAKKPFFFFFPTTLPHVALQIPEEEMGSYRALQWSDPPFDGRQKGYTPQFTPRAAYAAMITKLDKYVGEVLDFLREQDLAENTIVIFTSDNGPTHIPEVDHDFFQSSSIFKGLKGDLFEGGIRIPQIIRWPRKIAPDTTTDHVTGFEDWAPTLLELIGGKAPTGIDGVSFARTLLGKQQAPRPALYREFPGYGGQQAVWLDGRWKGIRTDLNRAQSTSKKLTTQLYDIEKDPGESTDVAAEHPEIVKEIEAIMKREHVPSEIFPISALDGGEK